MGIDCGPQPREGANWGDPAITYRENAVSATRPGRTSLRAILFSMGFGSVHELEDPIRKCSFDLTRQQHIQKYIEVSELSLEPVFRSAAIHPVVCLSDVSYQSTAGGWCQITD